MSTVDTHTYMGIALLSDFRWNKDVEMVEAKANRTLGFIRRTVIRYSSEAKAVATRPGY